MKRAIRHALCPALGSLVLACGGGGGSDVAGGGIGGTGVSSGPISGIGSIFVAGTEWQTGSAESITIDGVEVYETDLKLGMRTRVKGSKSADGESGTATSVAVDNSVEGPISDAPPPVASPGGVVPVVPVESVVFVVLGQTFVADGGTAFSDGASLDQLATGEGQWVEVSGLPGVDGKIHATRVELKATPIAGQPQSVEVEGLVSDRDSTSGDFALGSASAPATLSVLNKGSGVADCTGMTDYPDGEISDGMAVEVHGELLADGSVCASKVEHEDEFEDEDDFEIEGVVTEVTDATHFTLSGIPVVTNGSTEYGPVGLVVEVGMELEVEGSLVEGVLTASAVEQEAGVAIEAEVTDLSDDGLDFVVLGLPIHVDTRGGTQVEGIPREGSFVKVQAVGRGMGGLTAVEVEFESVPADRAHIEGRVDSLGEISEGSGSFSIHGVSVIVGPGTACEDASEDSCADFLDALVVGDSVEATDESFPFDFLHAAEKVSFDD